MIFPNKKQPIPQLPSGCKIPRPDQFDWQAHFSRLAGQTQVSFLRQFYQNPPLSGATPLDQASFLALDLETTGLSPEKDRIISIGFIPFDIRKIYCSGGRNFLINPGTSLAEASIPIHRITHSELNEKPKFDRTLPLLLQAMENRIVVAHCHAIERYFLADAVGRFFNSVLEFPMIDTMTLEKRLHNSWKRNFLGLSFFRQRRVSFRLDASRSRYGLPRYRPHHALTDALATAELFQAQVQALYAPNTPVRSLWV